MMLTENDDAGWMREALAEARQAQQADEVPVGAVVVCQGQAIGRGHDAKIGRCDPTAHAEIIALRQAAETLGDWRLEDCTLYVTLEPCPMCAGAILLARVPRLIYGAPNHKFGAVGAKIDLLDDARGWNHRVAVTGGVLAHECAEILKQYFSHKRATGDLGPSAE
ncbi:tRNA adenosine(34) deaminase TadA [Candidatus Sumerlaeota bacterium]